MCTFVQQSQSSQEGRDLSVSEAACDHEESVFLTQSSKIQTEKVLLAEEVSAGFPKQTLFQLQSRDGLETCSEQRTFMQNVTQVGETALLPVDVPLVLT